MARKRKTNNNRSQKTNNKSGMFLIAAGVIVLIAIGLFFAFGNRAGTPEQTPNQPNNIYQPPGGTPALTVLRPTEGQALTGTIISIKVNVTNFQLVDIAANRANVQNQGHLVYLLDGVREIKSIYKDYSMANVAAGAHTLTVELRNNDNTPLSPAVSVSVRVTVSG